MRPVRRDDIVSLASEDEVERLAHRLIHEPPHVLVPVVHRPATVSEPAAVVLFGSTRGLHDPVEGQEGAHCQLSHSSGSLLSFALIHPRRKVHAHAERATPKSTNVDETNLTAGCV